MTKGQKEMEKGGWGGEGEGGVIKIFYLLNSMIYNLKRYVDLR